MDGKQFVFDHLGRHIDARSRDSWLKKCVFLSKKGELSRIVFGIALISPGRVEVNSMATPSTGWPENVKVIDGTINESIRGWLKNPPSEPFVILEFGQAHFKDEEVIINHNADQVMTSKAGGGMMFPLNLIRKMDDLVPERKSVIEFVRLADNIRKAGELEKDGLIKKERAMRSKFPAIWRAGNIYRELLSTGPSTLGKRMNMVEGVQA